MANERRQRLLNKLKNIREEKASNAENDPVLPKRSRVESLIGGRQDLLSEFMKESRQKAEEISGGPRFSFNRLEKFINPIAAIQDIGQGLKGVGGVFQRAEAGVANIAQELQEGKPPSLDSLVQGISGERFGELGDLIRRTGAEIKGPEILGVEPKISNEFIASATGFAGFAGLTNLATKGKLIEGSKRIVSSFKKDFKRSAVKAKRKKLGFFKQKAEQFSQGLDDAFSGMRHEFDNVYNQIGDNIISAESKAVAQDVVNRLPNIVLNRVKNTFKLTGREIRPDINTVRRIKTEIGRAIPRKVWSGIDEATEAQAQMMDDYFKLNDIIANNSGDFRAELLRLNAKFKSLHESNRKIRPILKKASGTTKTTIRNIKNESMQGDLAEMMRFSNRFFKEGQNVLKEIDSFHRLQRLKKAFGGISVVGAGIAGVNRFVVNPIVNAVQSQGRDTVGLD